MRVIDQLIERVGQLIPRRPGPAAAVAVCVSFIFGLTMAALALLMIETYGLALFLGVPCGVALVATTLFGFHAARGFVTSFVVSVVPLFLTGAGLMVFAMEGALCILMALPLAVVAAVPGVVVGVEIQHVLSRRAAGLVTLPLCLLVLPVLMGASSKDPKDYSLIMVRTGVVIDAPPETVWQHTVSFDEIPGEPGWLFRQGISYPVRARIEGTGVGAVRYCEFTTGPFVEPITVWDEPRLLAFDVTSCPPPMTELNPFHDVAPAHLEGYFVSERGQLELTRLPNGRTLLEGTTWYRHAIGPAWYWQLWSDAIIHRIHLRVLNHIKALAEAEKEARLDHSSYEMYSSSTSGKV